MKNAQPTCYCSGLPNQKRSFSLTITSSGFWLIYPSQGADKLARRDRRRDILASCTLILYLFYWQFSFGNFNFVYSYLLIIIAPFCMEYQDLLHPRWTIFPEAVGRGKYAHRGCNKPGIPYRRVQLFIYSIAI